MNDNTTMPNTGTQASQATELNLGSDYLGEGIVYDPINDPNFTGTGSASIPIRWRISTSATPEHSTTSSRSRAGLSTSTPAPATTSSRNTANLTGIFVQTGGMYKNSSVGGVGGSLQLAATTGAIGIYEITAAAWKSA